jgi:hypothetical protein
MPFAGGNIAAFNSAVPAGGSPGPAAAPAARRAARGALACCCPRARHRTRRRACPRLWSSRARTWRRMASRWSRRGRRSSSRTPRLTRRCACACTAPGSVAPLPRLFRCCSAFPERPCHSACACACACLTHQGPCPGHRTSRPQLWQPWACSRRPALQQQPYLGACATGAGPGGELGVEGECAHAETAGAGPPWGSRWVVGWKAAAGVYGVLGCKPGPAVSADLPPARCLPLCAGPAAGPVCT